METTSEPLRAQADSDTAIASRVARPLLQELICELQRARRTALQFQVDSPSIASAVWNSYCPLLSVAERRAIADGALLCRTLDGLLMQACYDEPDEDLTGFGDLRVDRALGPPQAVAPQPERPFLALLAHWFDELCGRLHTACDLSVAVIALRLEGYGIRDISLRLGLGVRLVRRLLAQAATRLSAPDFIR